MRSQGLTDETINKTLRDTQFNDTTISPYPSFPGLFIITFESMVDEGHITKQDAIEKVRDQFNDVLQRVFSDYSIQAQLKDKRLQMTVTRGQNVFDVHNLSCGESEVFSLMFNIFANRERQDIFLIDEPELHLNWKLEEGLFAFLDWFCTEFNKQVIAATHSRAIFNPDMIDKIQYLVWENDCIEVKKDVSDKLKEDIAGQAVRTISAFEVEGNTFFTEDAAHQVAIESICEVLEKNVAVIKVSGGSSVVKNLCRAMRRYGGGNSLFLVDGDNQELDEDLRGYDKIIHLKKYCIENYFLDVAVLKSMHSEWDETRTKECIETIVKDMPRDSRNLVYIRLAEQGLLDEEVLDTFDASRILDKIAETFGTGNKREFMRQYIQKAQDAGRMQDLFGEIVAKVT